MATSVNTEEHLPNNISGRAMPLLRRLAWALPALSLLGFLPRIVIFVQAGISRIAWPWQIDYAEGVNLNAAYLLSQGQNIYRHNGPDSFISAPYPPLFFILTAPFQWLTGPSFGVGRTISLLATVAVAFLIGYIVWKVAANAAAAALASALWLTLSPVIVWSAFFKQDIPAMALDLAGVAWIMACVARDERPANADWGVRNAEYQGIRTTDDLPLAPARRGPARHSAFHIPHSAIIPALLFTLAFYMKQSAITGAAATGIWLMVRDWRTGIRFGIALGALILIPFFTANLLLQGGLWEHLVGYHSLPQTEQRFLRSITALLNEYWPILIIAGLTLLGSIVALVPRRDAPLVQDARLRAGSPLGLIVLYAILGWASTLTKSGYEGANFNHLMDGLLPTCILVGLAAAYLGHQLTKHQTSRLMLGLLGWTGLGVLLVAQILSFHSPQTWFTSGWPRADKNGEMQGFAKLVATTPGDMFSEDAYLLLANGKRIIYEDASTFVPLADLKEWDDRAFNQAILDRRFSLIFLLQGNFRWTASGLKAFGESYNIKFPGSVEAYEPKLFPSIPQQPTSCDLSGGGQNIMLTGYSLPPGVASGGIRPGDTLRVQLWWQPVSKPATSYASYVHLLNEKGDLIAGQDNPQTGAGTPTTEWQPGHPITDTASLPLPSAVQPGRYRLIAGMYHASSGTIEPLHAACRQDITLGDSISLGVVEIR